MHKLKMRWIGFKARVRSSRVALKKIWNPPTFPQGDGTSGLMPRSKYSPLPKSVMANIDTVSPEVVFAYTHHDSIGPSTYQNRNKVRLAWYDKKCTCNCQDHNPYHFPHSSLVQRHPSALKIMELIKKNNDR